MVRPSLCPSPSGIAGQAPRALLRKLALSDVRLRRMVRFDPAIEPDPREPAERATLIDDCLSNVASSKALAEASVFMPQSMANHRVGDFADSKQFAKGTSYERPQPHVFQMKRGKKND